MSEAIQALSLTEIEHQTLVRGISSSCICEIVSRYKILMNIILINPLIILVWPPLPLDPVFGNYSPAPALADRVNLPS